MTSQDGVGPVAQPNVYGVEDPVEAGFVVVMAAFAHFALDCFTAGFITTLRQDENISPQTLGVAASGGRK